MSLQSFDAHFVKSGLEFGHDCGESENLIYNSILHDWSRDGLNIASFGRKLSIRGKDPYALCEYPKVSHPPLASPLNYSQDRDSSRIARPTIPNLWQS